LSIHDGHRKRLKKRFVENGLDSFSDIEALEILLFYALPRGDTNVTAHMLLNHFQSFSRVMEAGLEDLQAVTGVGENAALLIQLVSELNRRYLVRQSAPGSIIRSSEDAGEFLIPYYTYINHECSYILCLDSKSQVLSCRPLASGMVNRVDFSVRSVVDIALRDNAVTVIISHNHVSGTALPSKADIETTKRLKNALDLIGVSLSDHIIVCEDDYVSMRDSGYFLSF